MPTLIRPATPDDHDGIAALTVSIYQQEGWAGDGYLRVLADVAGRAAVSQLLVAGEPGHLVGAVAVATGGGAFAEQAQDGEAVIRMLVTDPAARGRGVGAALVQECLRIARRDGCHAVRLSTMRGMAAAHRLYERTGFVRTPGDDWRPEPDLLLLTYRLEL